MASPLTVFPALWADAALPVTASRYTLIAFLGYMAGVFLLGALSHQLLQRGSFLKEYFLGDRKLNAWVLSLTYVATSVSAGSFVGFPSLIYTNGWIMALWIAGYMVGGLVSKGVLAKRLNQVSRLSGAITVPDVLRDRFQSPALGLLASVFLLLFLVFNLVGQFKAGGLIMQQACEGVAETRAYQSVRQTTANSLIALHVWDAESAQQMRGELHGIHYPDYVVGILIFSITVVAYTTYGGFWAVTWTDVLQGLMIVLGALLLMGLALYQVGGLTKATTQLQAIDPDLVTGPGPGNYLGPGLAVSFFFLWTLGSMGQPVGMVRLMACRDTPTLRRALFMIGLFYLLIYLPLVVAFVCARALYPTEHLANSDRIMPIMALTVTKDVPLLGGVILAAPYSAAMSAVAGYLLLMSSSLVRDIYQHNINPNVSTQMVRRITYLTTAVVGVIVTLAALWPPRFLQYLIIFTGGGMACTYLAPIVMALYWRRATRAGALAALLGGFGTLTILWLLGLLGVDKAGRTGPAAEKLSPVYLLGLDPLIFGLILSFALGIGVSLFTPPLPEKFVDRYFLADERSP
jgi:SSS family solute:Na+ symporter/sodium/pantothenate symporter